MLNARTLIAWRAASGERRWFAENLRVDRAELVRIVQSALEAAPAGILPRAAGPRADQPA
jgi:hypothetical protein